jgi:hypothetical protein
MFLGLGYSFTGWWWWSSCASSAGPTYFISYTDPHSMQRDLGSSRVRVIQRTLCESAGKPVQPTYCSLPAELTVMGSSIVPVFHQHYITPLVARTRKSSFFPARSRDGITYRDGWRPMASCRRYRYPASFREFRDARDRSPAQHRWERYRASHQGAEDPLRS